MRYIIIALLLTGCAHQTLHEYCSDPENLERYRDYNDCRASEYARRQSRAAAWKAFGDGFDHRSVNCTSTQYGNTTQTNCN